MSRTYHWAVIAPWIYIKGELVSKAMTIHSITPAVGAVGHCKAKAGLGQSPRGLHTRTGLLSLTAQIESDSSLKTFQSNAVMRDTTPNEDVGGWVPLAAHVMDATIPDIIQSGVLRWFWKTQITIVRVLPLSGQRSMRQLALRMRVV
ncbi:e3 ubiquitin-protein ligase RNF13 [Trichonephila clavipes]|nr:e3 ubiquitin-protein ligase RNF13 [Trichonephila clavipes]